METEFWLDRWQRGQLGWHLPAVHPLLENYYHRFNLQPGDTVFVPRCGTSLDMAWLAQQDMQVIGCELSPLAIEQFFEMQRLQPEKNDCGEHVCWQAGPYTLYEGDFFRLPEETMDDVKFIYDRAALISLPKEGEHGRKAYLRKLRELFKVDVQTLLVTLEYDQTAMSGPPVSVGYEEVIWHYAFDHIIEFLSETDILDHEAKFRSRGLRALTEWAFLLTRYQPVYAAFSDSPQDF